MVDFKEYDAKIKEVKIHYYRSGDSRSRKKQAFILLHGMSDNGLCWAKTAEHLAEKYDVIMPDTQGHGLSDRIDDKCGPKTNSDQIAGLIEYLKLQKPLVMGHSMGAGTASALAVDYPTLLKAVILEDPAWGMPSIGDGKMTEEFKKNQDNLRQYHIELAKRRVQDIVMEGKKANPKWQEYEWNSWATSKKQFDTRAFNHIKFQPYEEIVAGIKCPTLLICSDGGIVKKEIAEKAAQLWKSKEPFKWVYIKGAGHNIRREQYDAFIKAVEEFLKEVG